MSFRRNKARIVVTKVDSKEFAIWVSIALVAGSIPDMLSELSPWLLLSVWAIAALVALAYWSKNRRKEGIGVFVHLPGIDDPGMSEAALPHIHKWMSVRHRDWFRAGPDYPAKLATAQVRADWIATTIRHRLSEAELGSGGRTALFLYLYCRSPESFCLGATAAMIWQHGNFSLPNSTGEREFDNFRLGFRVRHVSTFERDEGEVYEINLADIDQPGSGRVDLLTDEVDLRREEDREKPREKPRLALVLYAALGVDRFQSFKTEALEAAKGSRFTGYILEEDDRCDHALVLSVAPAPLIDALRSGDADTFIRNIYQAWKRCSGRVYGSHDVPVRLFLQGPSILAFAAGALLPKGSRLIPWNRDFAAVNRVIDVPIEPDLIAIVDGDDVGARVEEHLLAGSLEGAISASLTIDNALKGLVASLEKVPSVELLSIGGDSAMFQVSRTALEAFSSTLGTYRAQTSFPFSCGLGADVRQAFLHLRMAKVTGKNSTIGPAE